MSRLPLNGVRVADFSWVLQGPRCTQWLGAMGAEVIRIETSRRLDQFRKNPPFAEGKPGLNRAGSFHQLNYSKKSCTLDLNQPEAAEIAKEIVKISDVAIENFAFGVIDRFGLSYSVLKSVKPDLIMVSSTALGGTGPEKHHVAYGATIHSFSGICSLTGYTDGLPKPLGGTYTDPLSGVTLAFAVLVALHHRARTGQGQFIDVSMAEATMVQLPEGLMDYAMNRRVRQPMGNRDDIMAPHGCYACKGEDKWVAIAVATEEEWEALCHVITSPALSRDERFADPFSRWQNQDELDRLIGEWTREHTPYEAMGILQQVGIAAGVPLDTEELLNDPHLKERQLFIEIDHPEVGRRPVIRLPWNLTPGPSATYEHAPLLGEHNEYVFQDLLGMSKNDIAQLIAKRIIY